MSLSASLIVVWWSGSFAWFAVGLHLQCSSISYKTGWTCPI